MATRMKEKSARREENRDRRPHAEAKYIRIPSSKVSIVLDLIRGKGYSEAVSILKHTNKSATEPILKLLESAAANGENNQNISKESMFVAECWASAGPTLKRMMPRARGRADRILKRTSHITIILGEREIVKPVRKAAKPATTKTTTTTKKPAATKVETPVETPIAEEPQTNAPLGTKKEQQ
jgi:large subunit ribosomal protein L22